MFSVAIDGPAGAGKSSIAKSAAKALGFVYVDTGALYRTVALYLLRKGVDFSDHAAVEAALPQIEVSLAYEGGVQRMFLCGEDVTDRIRTQEVSQHTSVASAIPAVRTKLLGLQRELAEKYDVLMDGRDIGTVVLPGAALKIYLTASAEERARRRVAQLRESGQSAEFADVLREVQERDHRDMNRETAPLKQADDAVLLDNSELDFEGSVAEVVRLTRERMAQQEVQA